jgi:hypothetical protein
LAQPGRPVCRLSAETVNRYLNSLTYEKLNDPGLRAALREARGFCPRHGWGLVRHGAALSAASLLRDVVQTLQRALAVAHAQSAPALAVAGGLQSSFVAQPYNLHARTLAVLSPQVVCPICKVEAEIEGDLLLSFAEGLRSDSTLLGSYRVSDGLCLPHFRQLLAHLGEEEDFDALIHAQQDIWATLERQLDELIRKSGFRNSQVALREESASWLRAIAATAGEVFGSGPHGDGYRQG